MKINAIIIALFWVGFSYAQEMDTLEDCKKYKSLYYQYLRQGMYEDARGFWLKARETCAQCDQLDYKLYKNGRVIYVQLRKKLSDSDSLVLKTMSDTILLIYNEGQDYVQTDEWNYDYATELMGQKKYRQTGLVDSLLRRGFFDGPLPRASTIEMYNRWFLSKKRTGKTEGNFGVTDEEAFAIYCELSKICHKGMESSEDSAKYWAVDMRMRIGAMKYAPQNVEALEQILNLSKAYSSNKTVLKSQLERNRDLLEACGHVESDLYSGILLKMLEEFPTSNGYADYAATNYRLERFSIAAQYYQKALEVQQDSSSLDIWRYKLAVSYYGAKEYRKAFKSAKLVNGENEALALKLSGDCIALLASECGNSTFERNANYWLANDYYLKAKFLGLNVSGKEYLSNAPAATEVFEQGLKIGDAYYLDCWKVKTVIR